MMWVKWKQVSKILPFLLVTMLLFSSVEAKGIEVGLGEISWDTDKKQVTQYLKGQGFEFVEQGKDEEGRQWQKFNNGQLFGFYSGVRLVWQSQQLAEVNIESQGVFFLGTEFTYQKLLAQFTDEYGPATGHNKYMLKIFPGIWVATTQWVVNKCGDPPYEVTIVQHNPVDPVGPEAIRSSKISITFKNIVANPK